MFREMPSRSPSRRAAYEVACGLAARTIVSGIGRRHMSTPVRLAHPPGNGELTEEYIAAVKAELRETDEEPLESPWHRACINGRRTKSSIKMTSARPSAFITIPRRRYFRASVCRRADTRSSLPMRRAGSGANNWACGSGHGTVFFKGNGPPGSDSMTSTATWCLPRRKHKRAGPKMRPSGPMQKNTVPTRKTPCRRLGSGTRSLAGVAHGERRFA